MFALDAILLFDVIYSWPTWKVSYPLIELICVAVVKKFVSENGGFWSVIMQKLKKFLTYIWMVPLSLSLILKFNREI